MKTWLALLMLIVLLVVLSCQKEEVQTTGNHNYTYDPIPYHLQLPNDWPNMPVTGNNPMTVEGVELGRMLYYDPIMHKDSAQSCASCHKQKQSFTDWGNCMHHVNLGWSHAFLWDGKVTGTLEDVMLFEVEDFFFTDFTRLNSSELYQQKFYEAFGIETITSQEAAKALAQFMRTVVSTNSRFDQYQKGNAALSASEERGMELFYSERGDCFHCHGTLLFTDGLFHNNALDSIFARKGLGDITGKSSDDGKFKSPTLRNVELTAPYMHDGRYSTLEEVIDFYSEGQKHSQTVDPLMYLASQGGPHFTNQEKADLVAFLKTLTDTSFINNPDLSSPFN